VAEGDDFERRLLLSVDARGYGGSTDRRQQAIQEGLLSVLDDAADRAGLARPRWDRQGAGDGELAVLPSSEPEPRVVDDFVRHLQAALRRHNREMPDGKRLRLRLAIHFGTAIPAPNGYRGRGPVEVSRLCDSDQLREVLAASGADLAVILSHQVFTDTIMQGHTSLEPADFHKVHVRKKEFDEDAWIWVPGHDVHAVGPPVDQDAPTRPPSSRAEEARHKSVHNTFNGKVDLRGSVLGFSESGEPHGG
jgi:class 3 adenylate cyclase